MNPETEEPSPRILHWSGMTHRGRVRKNNEDSFLALAFDANEVSYLGKEGQAPLDGKDFIFAVSDGMGGAQSGEFASKIAVEKITRLLPQSFRMSAQQLSAGFTDILTEVFHGIHAELTRLGHSYEECRGMGATLSLCWFTPGWMYFGHIGDSRIYYLPKDAGFTQITHDHTYVGSLRRKGELNERQHRTHPRRNVLQQALGAEMQFIDPQYGAVGCQPGDRFLLCTDGLTDGLWDRALQDALREPTPSEQELAPAQRLVQASLAESGNDNITAMVVEML